MLYDPRTICLVICYQWQLNIRVVYTNFDIFVFIIISFPYLTTHSSLSPIRCGFAPALYITKKGALDSQPQAIKYTSCLPMVGGSLRVLRLLPPIKLVAMILLKYWCACCSSFYFSVFYALLVFIVCLVSNVDCVSGCQFLVAPSIFSNVYLNHYSINLINNIFILLFLCFTSSLLFNINLWS